MYVKGLLLFITFCLVSINLKAQIKLDFSVDQPDVLVADAGEEAAINKGDQIQLGGKLTASGGTPEYTYLWSPTTGLDRDDIANPIASPDSTTTYTLIVTDSKGCSASSDVNVKVDYITGIDEDIDELINIYPNPNSGHFYIEIKSIADKFHKIEIISSAGNIVHEEFIPNQNYVLKAIRLMHLGPGSYLVRLQGKSLVITRKFIIN